MKYWDDLNWYEVRLRPGAEPDAFYAAIPQGSIRMFHHFWDEPWWPSAYVVRILAEDSAAFADAPDIDHFEPWDATPDERVYGEMWPFVAHLFWASSAISNTRDPKLTATLVHCLLNARGMSEQDEARFAVRFLWGRLTIKLRWRLYLKRRWQRRSEVAA